MLSGQRPESICNYGSCLHWGERYGDANSTQGHTQLASESGIMAGMHPTTAEQSKRN